MESVTVTGGSSYAEVVASLASAQKGAKGAPAYSRFVNRKLGRYLAAWAYLARLSPNQVTAISAGFSVAALVLLATVEPSWWLGILITFLLLVGYAFDSADGQLARIRKLSSKSGEWLDHMVDCTKISSMHLAVLISMYRFDHLSSAAYLLIPLGFCVVTAVLFFGMILNDQLRRVHAASTGVPMPTVLKPSTLRSLVVVPTDYGVVCAMFILLGWLTGFRIVYAVLFVAHVGFLLLASRKWFREMKALDGHA
jgi:phosphatidylglycerophosphate synthase